MPPRQSKSGAWWKRGLLGLAALCVVSAGASTLVGTVAPDASTNVLTHRITRGDLVVSVTEEGTLESSSNKEIKCKVKGGSTVIWVIESGTEVEPGDELVRLDTSTIEDNISQQTITYQNALATYAQSESDVAVAEISITEYLEGTFRTEMQTAESNVAIGEEDLRVAQNVLEHAERMFRKGYISKLELDGSKYAVEHARLQLDLYQTQVDALERFTKPKMLQELQSTLKAAQAKLASDKAALDLEKARLTREEKQLDNCLIRAESQGMVIYPNAEEWKNQPDIEEGAAVREDQVLLMMPDLNQMQVKLGIHEAKIDRVKVGMPAQVELQDRVLKGEVESIASIAGRSGWWNGNMVKYDTIIRVDTPGGLRPGMSAAVEVFLSRHEDVLTIPVAAVVQQDGAYYCWVKSRGGTGAERRRLELSDSNDQFIVVQSGVKEGDDVVLNPIAYIEEARAEALRPIRDEPPREAQAAQPEVSKTATGKTLKSTELGEDRKKSDARPEVTGRASLKAADKSGDVKK
jgi:multidrug efflux pump subunit AcrA (membrane-fusion protein)